jgi:hypothetical protein
MTDRPPAVAGASDGEQRRAQLVRGIGEKTLLNRARLAHPGQQLVECLDGGRDLRRRAGFGKWA